MTFICLQYWYTAYTMHGYQVGKHALERTFLWKRSTCFTFQHISLHITTSGHCSETIVIHSRITSERVAIINLYCKRIVLLSVWKVQTIFVFSCGSQFTTPTASFFRLLFIDNCKKKTPNQFCLYLYSWQSLKYMFNQYWPQLYDNITYWHFFLPTNTVEETE